MIKINKMYLIALVISFYFALSYGGVFPYYVFYAMFFIFLLTIIYLTILGLFLEIQVVFEENYLFTGEEANCTTIVKCAIDIPVPYLEIKSSVFNIAHTEYSGQLINLNSQESQWIRNNIIFNSRGIYDLGEVDIKIIDIFRIMEFNKRISTGDNVKVYPKLYDFSNFTSGGKDIYREVQDINGNNEDQFTIKDVRKYKRGDSLKKIHWKLSARYGELYVKNSETISGEEAALFIDLNKDNYIYDEYGIVEEKVVDLALSLVNLMRNKEIDTEVFINARMAMNFNISSKEDFEKLVNYFVIQKSDGEIDFSQFTQENYYKVHRANKLLLVTSRITDNFIQNMIRIMNSGYSVTIYYTLEENNDKSKIEDLKNFGIKCFSFSELTEGQGVML